MGEQDEVYLSLETDPRTEQYSLRIPAVTKAHIERLDDKAKKDLIDAIMQAIDKVLYMNDYKPGKYLKEQK